MSDLARRHHLAILFADMSRSTAIAGDIEPEVYAALLGRLRGIYASVIGRHGGEIVRIDGDGALAIFGYPVAHEDAGRRAVEAAIDLREAIRSLSDLSVPAPEIHSGIHAGMVLLQRGDLVRGRYEILGDATNVAARLCDAAVGGEILVSEATLGSDRYFYEISAARLVAIAGRRDPVTALAIGAREDVPHRFAARSRGALTPFVGRRGERDSIQRWLVAYAGTALLVHGPAGIGKSRILSEAMGDASGTAWQVERGYCEAYLHARPLQPFLQIAEGLAPGVRDAGAPRAADLLNVIEASVRSAPLLLALDDWQWADDASRDLLAAILRSPMGMGGERLKLLLASRDEDIGFSPDLPIESLALAPLQPAATQEAVVRLFSGVDPFTLARVEKASGGSPLLIEELCHAFANGKAGPDADPREAWFDLAVQARFAALDEKDADFVRLVAVAGQNAPIVLLARTEGHAIDPAMIDRLEAADFLFMSENGQALRFKHGLTRDAVYAGIGLETRRDFHGRIFETLLEQSEEEGEAAFLDPLAYHGGLSRPAEKAFPLTLRAGDSALALGALDRAQAHYRAAFGLASHLKDPGGQQKAYRALLNKFGLASIVAPSPDQLPLIAEARAVMQGCADRYGLYRSAYWLGAISYGVGLGKYSVTCLRDAVRLSLDAEPRFRDQASLKLAQSLFAAGLYDEATATFEEMIPTLVRAGVTIDGTSAAYALACYGFLRADRGEFDAAERLFQDAEARLRDERDPMNASLYSYRTGASMWRGDWRQSLAHAEHGQACSDRSRTRYLSMKYRAQIAYSNWNLTRDRAEVKQLEDVGRWFLVEGNSRQRASLLFGWLVEMHADLGDAASARRYAAEIVDRVRVGGDRLGEAMAWRALSRLAASSDPSRADHYLKRAESSARIRGSRREMAENLAARAGFLKTQGDGAAAAAMAAAAAAEYSAMGMFPRTGAP